MTPSTDNDFSLDDERLTPELSALEARLSDLKPRTFPGADVREPVRDDAFFDTRSFSHNPNELNNLRRYSATFSTNPFVPGDAPFDASQPSNASADPGKEN